MRKKSPERKRPATPKYDSARQQNVLLDKMYSEIKTIGEGHSLLSDKIEEMDKLLMKLDSKSFSIEMTVQAIKSQAGTIDIKVDRVEKELESVKAAAMENSNDIKEIKNKLDVVTMDHEQRLQKIEAA